MKVRIRTSMPLFGLAAALAGAQVATAQSALEEVVVTAQKREESIQSTPISLAAFGTGELENKGISGLTDLRAAVPNLQMTPHPNSGATARIFMRGIGNNDDQITQDPSVAVYLDGVYVARSQGLAMDVADIERVEVLRGPQGSLYGRNATGGAINFITRAPELGRFGFQQNLTVGSDNLLRSRTQVNAPIGDQAAVQLSYLKAQKDGFVKNAGTGVSRFGDQDREAYRLAFHWQPSDVVDILYSYDRSNLDDTPAFIALAPYHPRQAHRPTRGSAAVKNLRANDIGTEGHNLTISWELSDSLSFKSITGYRELDNFTYQDYHTGVVGPFPMFITQFDSSQDQFSQEFQLVGDALDSRLEYVAGIYYFDESGDSFDITDPADRPGLPAITYRDITIDNTAYAVYGQGTYTPAVLDDKLHVTVGLRWSKDERKATRDTRSIMTGGGLEVEEPGKGDNDFSNFSPSLIVAYDVSDSINVYGKVVTGYKTGGFNTRSSTTERFNDGFDEENLISYELGVKSQWWEDRVRLNAAVFRADYDDIQVTMQVDPVANPNLTDVFNAGKAQIDGVELELSVRPTEGLTVSARYAYLNAEYEELVDPFTGVDVADRFYFVEAPENSYTLDVQYEFPATPIGVFTVMADYSWQDEKITASNDKRYVVDDLGLLNARLNLSEIPVGAGELRLGLWGRNLEDKEYYAAHFPSGMPSAVFGEPRSYGIDLVYEY